VDGRTYWEIIDNENPRVEGRHTIVTKVEAQQQRSVMANDQQVGMAGQNGTAVYAILSSMKFLLKKSSGGTELAVENGTQSMKMCGRRCLQHALESQE
jgi:hypothetical protein